MSRRSSRSATTAFLQIADGPDHGRQLGRKPNLRLDLPAFQPFEPLVGRVESLVGLVDPGRELLLGLRELDLRRSDLVTDSLRTSIVRSAMTAS